MRCVSGLVILVLFSYSVCASSTNATEGACEVTGTTAVCRGVFQWPEDLRITRIVVRSDQLTKIEKNDLAKYENLETLDASNSGLLHIDSEAFLPNEKFTELNLSGNKDFKLPTEGPFISSKSLTHLNLSHLTIEELPENVLKDLPNLQVIDLTSTIIKNFSSLSNSENLQSLIISENSELNKTSLCHETHLHQITEIENNKRTTFNCPDKTNEVKHTTEPEPVITVVVQNIEKEDKRESESTVESETKPPMSEVTEPVQETNTSTPEKDQPENLEEQKSVSPGSTNSTDPPETPKGEEETEDTTEKAKDNHVKVEPNTEMGNETGVTQNAIVNEDNTIENSTNDNKLLNNLVQSPSPNDEKKIDDTDGQDNPDAKTGPSQSQPAPNESSGVNIVLGIIVCVVVVGAVGFAYKYWKNRRGGYSNANTEDVEEGKELQNMVSHRAANGEPEQN